MAADLRVQRYLGRPVLTWWQGYSGAGVGAGEDEIYDSSYRRVAEVRAGNGLTADLHEFRLTPQGTALITAYYPVYWDASALHSAKQQIVLDSVVQEIDIKTGLVLYQWDSLDHVPLADSYEAMPATAGGPFDYFHINSVQQQQDGDLLISARNTWAAYDVDHATGAIRWTLGGKNSSYKLSSNATFAFQHDVRLHTDSDPTVTLFDDGAGPPKVHAESRGITVRLDEKAMTATLVSRGRALAGAGGQLRGQRAGAVRRQRIRGLGPAALLQRVQLAGPDGVRRSVRRLELELPRLPLPVDRARRPSRPAVAASSTGGTTNVYVSWNGATDVASWRVLAGPAPDALEAVVTATKQGFETQIPIACQPYVAVQALDDAGRALATSSVVHVS